MGKSESKPTITSQNTAPEDWLDKAVQFVLNKAATRKKKDLASQQRINLADVEYLDLDCDKTFRSCLKKRIVFQSWMKKEA